MRIREAILDDHGAIMDVHRRNGMSTSSFEEWKHLRNDYPATKDKPVIPIGWVLEDDEGVVRGAFGNIYMAYEWNGRRYHTADASAWSVDRKLRGQSLRLVMEYFRQENAEILINTTAIDVAGRAFMAFRGRRLPHPNYDDVMLWITNHTGFAESALSLKFKGFRAMKYPLGVALRASDMLRRGTRLSGIALRSVRVLKEFDSRFDAFWDRLRGRWPNRLQSVRNCAALKWHFKYAIFRDEVRILVLEDGEAITGYLILRRNDRGDIGLKRYWVADLQVVSDEERQTQTLMSAALALSRDERIDVVEALGFAPAKRRALEMMAPRLRKLPTWPLFYKANDPGLRLALEEEKSWDPCPFDGDATL